MGRGGAGTLSLTVDVLQCARTLEAFPEFLIKQIEVRTDTDPTYTASLPVAFDVDTSMKTVVEQPTSCQNSASPQIDGLQSVIQFRGEAYVDTSQSFLTSQYMVGGCVMSCRRVLRWATACDDATGGNGGSI